MGGKRGMQHGCTEKEVKRDFVFILVAEPEYKGPLERNRCRWKNDIKWILKRQYRSVLESSG